MSDDKIIRLEDFDDEGYCCISCGDYMSKDDLDEDGYCDTCAETKAGIIKIQNAQRTKNVK